MIYSINENVFPLCLLSNLIPFKFLTVLMPSNQTGVFACTPALPVASDEGKVRDLKLSHLDWHNFTALANTALHIMENIQELSK